MNVIGGSSAAAGTWLRGITNVFADLGYGDTLYWNVSHGGRLNVQQVFVDGGGGGSPTYYADLTDTNQYDVFSLSGASLYLSPYNTFLGGAAYAGYEGTCALVDMFLPNSAIGANGTASGTTAFSDSANPFVSAMVGHTLVITNGACTHSSYTVATFVDAGHITLNTTPGTCSDATWAVPTVSASKVPVTGSSANANILGLGLTFYPGSPGFTNTSSPAATTEQLNGFNFDFTTVTGITEQGCCNTPFLTTTLNQIRTSTPTFYYSTPSSVTDVFMSRVYVTGANYGIHLKH